MIHISIADNHPVVTQGLKSYFQNHETILICDTLFDFKSIEDVLMEKKPQILILDIELEGLQSISALKKLILAYPKTKFLIYTSAAEKLFGVSSLKAGAAGFLSKRESLEKLEQTLHLIADGGTAFSTSLHKSISNAAGVHKEERTHRKLSTREKQVLTHLAKGKKNNEISEALNLNEKTISTYKLRLLNKLNVTNLIDLVNKAKILELV